MSRSQGKILLTFPYDRNGHHLTVPLRIRTVGGRLICFVHLDAPVVRVEGTDPEQVRQQACAELDKVLSIVWKRVLLVHMDNRSETWSRDQQTEAKVRLSWRPLEIGTTSLNETVHRVPALSEHPTHTYPTHQGDGVDDSEAMIDDTPENRAKLEAVSAAIHLLGQRLEDLLGQKNILSTLANVQVLGLPMPKGMQG